MNAEDGVRATFAGLSEAWRDGDGSAFAAWCTEDADFVNLLGMYVKGRPAVAALHQKVFDGPYAGSVVTFTVETVRRISDDMVLVLAPARVDVPAGPIAGTVSSIASVLLVREGERWSIVHFQNTKRESTAGELTAILADVQQKERN